MKNIFCLGLLVFVPAGSAFAETYYVSPGESIQAAIDSAADGDTVSIAAGTYYEISINPNGKEITIRGETNGKGLPAVTIDGQSSGTVLTCSNGETSETIFENLQITGGYTDTYGGGMHNENSDPTITNCVFTSNSAGIGGGMCNDDSHPNLEQLYFYIKQCSNKRWRNCERLYE